MAESLTLEPLAAPLGVVIRGADFGDLDEEFITDVRTALAQFLVVIFRGHEPPTDEQLFSFGQALGPVQVDIITQEFTRPGFPGINVISNIVEQGRPVGAIGSIEVDWHTDYSFKEQVSRLLFLEAVEVAARGGETAFNDMYAVLETLPAELRERVETTRISHTLSYDDPVHGHYEETAEHPAVITNPATGRRALYLSPSFEPKITGVDPDDGAVLLEQLQDWATQDRFAYEHAWQAGDLVVWDSIGSMHRRNAFGEDDRRYMRKMSILVDESCEPWPIDQLARVAAPLA